MNYIVENQSFFISKLNEYLEKNHYLQKKIFVLTDKTVEKLCVPFLLPLLSKANYQIITCLSGEENKTINECNNIWSQLIKSKCDRYSLIINVGGGLICDMGAFIATTFKRGVKFIFIPTTLLAQTDAAFGGKNGVNFNNLKNQIGTFANPELIAVNPGFLKTLNQRQFQSGIAEIIKHGIIKNKNIINNICTNPDDDNFLNMLKQSIKVKIDIVEKDFYEKNIRKTLNFGHTVGHAVETALMPEITHGEAVAFGMIVALILSEKYYHLKDDDLKKCIFTICNNVKIPPISHEYIPQIMSNIIYDKKNKDDNINFVLLKNICEPIIDVSVNKKDIEDAIYTSLKIFETNNTCNNAQSC